MASQQHVPTTDSHRSETDRSSSDDWTDKAEQKARAATDKAQEQAQHLAHQAKDQVQTQLAGQKDRATEHLSSITTALHETSDHLRDHDEDAVARYVDRAAQQVDQFSHYLRNHTVSELLAETERYARREPALFLGGAALLGLASARFLKSSDSSQTPPRSPRSSRGRRRDADGSWEHDEVYRRSRGSDAGYSRVHGTDGAEMPDPHSEGPPRVSRASFAAGTAARQDEEGNR